ncbi:MAG: hypothetical protein HY782_23580 [Chloroflexi bacterium]|nr:hypothetical protein [Chloroflexota bacterium]
MIQHPRTMILVGFILLVVGVLLPFAMLLRVLEPTLLLGFLSWGASLVGLALGVLGVVTYSRARD